MKKKTIILGIETSCDETAVSIIQENENNKPSILSNIISSQVDVHKEFGGVVPELAARSHIEKIDLIAKKAITKKTGARGLRSILESLLLKTMFNLPSQQNVEEVIVDRGVVLGQIEPIIVYSKNKNKTNKSSAA